MSCFKLHNLFLVFVDALYFSSFYLRQAATTHYSILLLLPMEARDADTFRPLVRFFSFYYTNFYLHYLDYEITSKCCHVASSYITSLRHVQRRRIGPETTVMLARLEARLTHLNSQALVSYSFCSFFYIANYSTHGLLPSILKPNHENARCHQHHLDTSHLPKQRSRHIKSPPEWWQLGLPQWVGLETRSFSRP